MLSSETSKSTGAIGGCQEQRKWHICRRRCLTSGVLLPLEDIEQIRESITALYADLVLVQS